MSMEQNGNQNMSAASFCRNGCGFYAAQAFDGMCSKCYKDLKELQQTSQDTVTTSPTSSSSPSPSLAGGRVSVDGGSNKKTDVDIVASSLSRTSLGDMNLNSSSNSGGSSDKLTGSSSGGAVGGVSEVETASPTVATAKTTCSGDKTEDAGEGMSTEGGDGGSSDGEKGKKAKKNRCMECRKKVGLTGFQCHCGKLFCSLHRYSDTHDCTFDFKEQGAQEIRKNNPVVKGEKVQKI